MNCDKIHTWESVEKKIHGFLFTTISESIGNTSSDEWGDKTGIHGFSIHRFSSKAPVVFCVNNYFSAKKNFLQSYIAVDTAVMS